MQGLVASTALRLSQSIEQCMLTATGAFAALILISAAAGFSPSDYSIPSYKQSDKALHFVAFFLLTVAFYWILETSRRKVLQFTLLVCTLGLGVASEVVQGLLPVWLPLGGMSSIWS